MTQRTLLHGGTVITAAAVGEVLPKQRRTRRTSRAKA